MGWPPRVCWSIENGMLTQRYIGPLTAGTVHDTAHTEGVKAYAASQAALYRGLRRHFQQLWTGLDQKEEALLSGRNLSTVMRTQISASNSGDEDTETEEGNDEMLVLPYVDDEDDDGYY
jgi:hypothetical protein